MSGLWYHFPVLIANHAGFDASLALKLTNQMQSGHPVLRVLGHDGPVSGSCWVMDAVGNRLGWISPHQNTRFAEIFPQMANISGEFAFMMQFGWMMRVTRPSWQV